MKRAYELILFFVFCLILSPVVSVFAQRAIPVIERIEPVYGAIDVDTQTKVSITFNSDMDKKSVKKNFHIFPEVKGILNWQDSTMIFSPHKPLLPSTSYFISFTPDLKNINGIPLSVTYFSTPAEGVFVGPEGEISIVSINAKVQKLNRKGNNPVWSSDNKSIIYDFEGAIWKIDTVGNNKEQISYDDETYKATQPVCSTFLDKIAYLGTNSAGSANVFTIDLKTEMLLQLTSFYEPTKIEHLSWSPDGLYLAFLRAGQIWIMNNDGKDLKKLTTDELVCKDNFAWSPGGTKIAFTGPENVWVGDVYSAELRKMSFDDSKTGVLDWSQDNKLAFVLDGITIMNADGSEEIKVLSAAKNPVWINNGELLSFVLPLEGQDNKAQLWVMDSKGENKKKITEINSEQRDVSWSSNIGYWNLFSP
ncbi:MAG: Ig-like domain-containing protein [Candidatus Omnitrophica bacterium]|nr:Ig-like domain-containing protein [Candidatus Omnitrophota bacterium]